MNILKFAIVPAVAIGSFGLSGVPASAAVNFTVFGSDNTVQAEISFAFEALDPTTGKFTFVIENTTGAPHTDPRLTSFAFLVPENPPDDPGFTGFDLTEGGGDGFTASGFGGAANWEGAFGESEIGNIPQHQISLNAGGLSGQNFAGGDPNSGITNTESGTFMLWLTGTNVDQLTEGDFNITSTDPYNFAARFQRLDNAAGSDVAVVPLPAPALLLLGGLGALGSLRSARRKAA